MVFQRNKELLREVGRRDFELGSAPSFPAVRVEIVWEEWFTTPGCSARGWETGVPKFSYVPLLPYPLFIVRVFGSRERKTRASLMCWNRITCGT